jgi:hypothetical protein
MSSWPIEEIPDPDTLYYRVHVNDGLGPNIFRERDGGMSVNWSKYRTAEDTRTKGARKQPSEYGVIALVAGRIRSVQGLSVEHTPREDNRSHSDVRGLGTSGTELNVKRHLLFARCDRQWLIAPG